MFKKSFLTGSRVFSRALATKTSVAHRSFSTPLFKSTVLLGAFSLIAYQYHSQSMLISNDFDQAHLHPEESVTVDNSLTPFPIKLTANEFPVSSPFTLMGYGRRAVTFLKVNIYGLGIYISDSDLLNISKVFNSKYLSQYYIDQNPDKPHRVNLEDALKNPKISMELVSDLLDSEIEMIVKITPIRNTDFNHLRDGLCRSTMSHPEAKKHTDEIKVGIDLFKQAFSKKGSVQKNEDLLIKKNRDNTLELYYKNKEGEITKLGVCQSSLVGKCLFGKYLSVPKPLSPAAQTTFVEKVANLV